MYVLGVIEDIRLRCCELVIVGCDKKELFRLELCISGKVYRELDLSLFSVSKPEIDALFPCVKDATGKEERRFWNARIC